MAEYQLSDRDSGAVVEVRVGDVIELCLSETASGGYRWQLECTEPGILEAREPTYEFRAGEVGGRSVARFRFSVKSIGTSAIRLEYARPWEKAEPPTKIYNFTAVASGAHISA
jgi:predicted secreted protein